MMDVISSKDAINMVVDGKASEFKAGVNAMLMDKVHDAIEIKKAELAQNFMSEPEQTQDGT
jgi:hypothetical protein